MPNLPKYTRPKQARPKQGRYPTSDQIFYNSQQWRKTRAYRMQENPLCEVHLKKDIYIDCTYGGVTDHIVPISSNGAKLNPENLMTLCPQCHNRKSGLEQKERCLVQYIESEGENIPDLGEKNRLIKRLAEYL
jgi:5-methylcytosine-specific restriction endonuclease McrA